MIIKAIITIVPLIFIPFVLGAVIIHCLRLSSENEGRGMKPWRSWPLSFALGSGLLTLFMFWLSLCGVQLPKGNRLLVFLWAVIFLSVVLCRNKILDHFRNASALILNPQKTGILALAALFWGVSILEPLVLPLRDWDVIMEFGFKAKVLFFETARDTQFFQDVTHAYSHLDYPLYMPFLYVWIYSIVGSVHEHWAVIFNPIVFGLLLLFFYNAVKEKSFYKDGPPLSSAPSLLFTIILACLPFLHHEHWIVMQRPDFYVAFYYLLAVAHCWKWILYEKKEDLLIASALCVLLGWIKLEGMMLGGVLFVLLALFGKRDLLKKVFLSFGTCVLFVLPWYLYRTGIPKVHENYGGRMIEYSISEIVPLFIESFVSTKIIFSYSNWLIFWPVFIITILAGYKIFFRSRVAFLSLSILLPAFAFIFVIALSPSWWTPSKLVSIASERLFLELAPASLFIIAVHYNRFASASKAFFFGLDRNRNVFQKSALFFILLWAGISVSSFFPISKRYVANFIKYSSYFSSDLEEKRRIISKDYYPIWKIIGEFHGAKSSPLFVTLNYTGMSGAKEDYYYYMGDYFLCPIEVYFSEPGKIFLGTGNDSIQDYPTDQWLKSRNIFARAHFFGKYGDAYVRYKDLMTNGIRKAKIIAK